MRVTVPSPWFRVQIEPAPAVKNRGMGPTGIAAVTSPVLASTAVNRLTLPPVIHTVPSLKHGL